MAFVVSAKEVLGRKKYSLLEKVYEKLKLDDPDLDLDEYEISIQKTQ